MNTDAAILIVTVLVVQEALKLSTGYFFKKLTRDDYVTRSECVKCTKSDKEAMDKLSDGISTIKGLLLALAMKKELTADDLKALMDGH